MSAHRIPVPFLRGPLSAATTERCPWLEVASRDGVFFGLVANFTISSSVFHSYGGSCRYLLVRISNRSLLLNLQLQFVCWLRECGFEVRRFLPTASPVHFSGKFARTCRIRHFRKRPLFPPRYGLFFSGPVNHFERFYLAACADSRVGLTA